MRLALLPLALVCTACPVLAADVTITGTMNEKEVEQALLAYPPSAQNVAERALIAQSMDKLVRIAVKRDITDEQVEQLRPLRDLYLRQVDRGLDELEKCEVGDGAGSQLRHRLVTTDSVKNLRADQAFVTQAQ